MIAGSPAVAYGNVYIGSEDQNVYCLNAFTGESIWNYTTAAGVFSSPAIVNGNVYIGSDDNRIYCLNALTGDLTWNFSAGDLIESSPAVSYGNVYVGSFDRNIYCLNATTGASIWNYTTDAEVFSSPAVADGSVYLGSFDRNIYCLNATTGASIWNYATDGIIVGSPAVAHGNVYIGSEDQKIYCFGLADTSPPNITDVSQTPLRNNVLPEDIVNVNATVTDNMSGVKRVTLNYTGDNETWTNIAMSNLKENIWSASIPTFPYGTTVTYIIQAQDNADNTITTSTMGNEYQYQVIPEFPTMTIALLLFMISTLLAVAIHRRKQS
jgi:glucose dehydrogenase